MALETTMRERTARIPHICNECKTPIEAGSAYTANSLLIDGKYQSMKRHADCIEAGDSYDAEINSGEGLRPFLYVMCEGHPQYLFVLNDFPEVLKRLKSRQ